MTATAARAPPDRRTAPGAARAAGARAPAPRIPGPDPPRRHCPTSCCCPPLVLELLVHLVPMVVGVVMSFKELTQFYIRNWGDGPLGRPRQLPGRRRLRRARSARRCSTPSSSPAPSPCCRSACPGCSASAAAICMQETFRGRGLLRALFLTPYALPVYAAVITWAFMFQRDNGLVNHVLHDQLRAHRQAVRSG